jgi:hypothetical protein
MFLAASRMMRSARLYLNGVRARVRVRVRVRVRIRLRVRGE